MNYLLWLLPILGFAIIAPFTPFLDLQISNAFYTPGKGFVTDTSFYLFWYNYGDWPSFIVCGLSIIALVFSYFWKPLEIYRKTALLFVLVFFIGVGLIVNALFKDLWGRPRPKQIEMFGGKYPYAPFYQPDFGWHPDKRKSFPSGHAAAGFYFLVFVRAGVIHRNKTLFYTGIILAAILGGCLSLSRVAMGGHFFSDVLASALIMWLTTLFFEWVIFYQNSKVQT